MMCSFQGCRKVFDRFVRQAVENRIQLLELRLPQRAVLAKPIPERRDGVRFQAAGAGGAVDAGFDQSRFLQHLQVAADRGLADGKRAGEVLHRRLALRQPRDDGAAGRVGEGGEGLVEDGHGRIQYIT